MALTYDYDFPYDGGLVGPTNTSLPQTSYIQNMYQRTIDAYTGLGGFYDKTYIDRYRYESSKNYFERRKTIEYINQVKGIIDGITDPVFANPIEREELNLYEEAFVEDVDGNGTSMTEFLNEVGVYHQLIGNVFIVFDTFKEIPNNLVESIENRAYPYMYMKLGNEVASLKQDKTGKLKEISFYYGTTTDKKGHTKTLYQHIDAAYTYTYYIAGTKRVLVGPKIESSSNGLPVIMTGTKPLPTPRMYSLAAQAKIVFNKGCELRASERDTNLSILQIPGIDPKTETVIKNIAYINPESPKDLKWVSPDSSVMGQTLTNVQAAVDDLEMLGQSFGAIPITNQAKSGVSYAYEFVGNTTVLTALAGVFQKVEGKIFKKFAEFFTWDTNVIVTYDTNYTPGKSQLEDQLVVLKDAVDRTISITATKVFNKRIVDVVDALGDVGMDEATLNQIYAEIDMYPDLNTIQKIVDLGLGDNLLLGLEGTYAQMLNIEYNTQERVNEQIADEDLEEAE